MKIINSKYNEENFKKRKKKQDINTTDIFFFNICNISFYYASPEFLQKISISHI